MTQPFILLRALTLALPLLYPIVGFVCPYPLIVCFVVLWCIYTVIASMYSEMSLFWSLVSDRARCVIVFRCCFNRLSLLFLFFRNRQLDILNRVHTRLCVP